ncbi:MAG: MobA/MobL family protein [Rhizobiales bacterium]|nr:MobA/MobL family protein [Hyphomicrobiales bacterium]
MATSLPPDTAIFNVRVSVFQRSAGRSAVAAAAYRSASRLTDERIGETFDYTKKRAEDSFILAPPDAPAWAYDRAQLWNRVEAAEKRKDAVVAREVLITIPRDIPADARRAFAEAAVASYVAAGAVVDVAIHCPADVYGEEQPHIHVMLASRCVDASELSGFAKTRNAVLTAMFESGGRHGGGERGDALKAERERIAGIMNRFLESAGSARRADHRTNAARGLHDREPEPTMGESRLATVKKRKRHDRKSVLVAGIRNTRIQENQLLETEEEIMATTALKQADNGIRPRSRVNFKQKLLRERFPGLRNAAGWAENLHFIDANTPGLIRIATKDGGHLEIRGRLARVFGQRGQADALADALRAADDLDDIERLEELKSLRRKGNGVRPKRDPDEVPQLPAEKVESIADKWRSRGFTKITEAPDGVWIEIGKCRLQDLGDELRIHGPAASDAAVRAMLSKAVDEWDSSLEVFGDRAFKDATWLEAQRQGVTVYDQATGQLYEPSEEVRKKFEADHHRARAEGDEMAALKAHKAMASLVLEAAAGDSAALKKLQANDKDLADFITMHLDDEQRGRLVGKPEADVVAALPSFRAFGKTARQDDDEKRKREGLPAFADDYETAPGEGGDDYEERRPR